MIPDDLTDILPATTVKRRFLELLNRVGEERSIITITRNGVPAGVLMSAEDYGALMETLQILADRTVTKALSRARRGFSRDRALSHDEVWQGE